MVTWVVGCCYSVVTYAVQKSTFSAPQSRVQHCLESASKVGLGGSVLLRARGILAVQIDSVQTFQIRLKDRSHRMRGVAAADPV